MSPINKPSSHSLGSHYIGFSQTLFLNNQKFASLVNISSPLKVTKKLDFLGRNRALTCFKPIDAKLVGGPLVEDSSLEIEHRFNSSIFIKPSCTFELMYTDLGY